MRPAVRAAFVRFTEPLEGVVPWMYADVKGLITVAIGNLIDPVQYALPLPFLRQDGTPAGRDEIAAEWLRVKNDPLAARLGHRYARGLTRLRLDDDGIALVVGRKLQQNDDHLRRRFAEYDEWPADAQLGVLSMAWACGPAFRFPMLESFLRAKDFHGAAQECHIDERGNPGVKPRNKANKVLFMNAARVFLGKLDPERLHWPTSLVDEEDTDPEIPAYTTPADRPTRLPLASDAAAEFLDLPRKLSEDDDEPPEAA